MNEMRTVESAAVAAYGRSAQDGRRTPSGWVFTLILMVVFFLVMMMCLATGVSMYRSVAAKQARESALHMQSGLMAGIVHMNDSAYAIGMAAGPQGDALVLAETLPSGTYETRMYLLDGTIVQEYAIAGRGINPENAIPIMESGSFEFSYSGGLLTLVTDGGASQVALRSVQGDAAVASAGFDEALANVGAGDAQ